MSSSSGGSEDTALKAILKATLVLAGLGLAACQTAAGEPIAQMEPAQTAAPATAERPNILFIITDDMYPWMFNNLPQGQDSTGKGRNVTPHIDELIRTGSFLSEMYVASPVCTPSRYNVLTGNYASRAQNKKFTNFTRENEGQTVIQWNSFVTPGGEKTLGDRLQALGYRTGFVGKNHVIESLEQVDQSKRPDLDADPRDPEVKALLEYRHKSLQEDIKASGFDYADNLYDNNPRWLGVDALAVQNMDWITQGGVNFLKEEDDRPFFLYFATTLPHAPTAPKQSWLADPLITPKGFLDEPLTVQPPRDTLTPRVEAAGQGGKGQENLLWLDDGIGALLDELEKSGKLDNTIIVFFNDHGQQEKGTLYEGGLHTQAFVWRKQGFACGSDCDFRASNTDFLETILELAGEENVARYSDGRSFAGALNGVPRADQRSGYHELGFARAVVKDGFKYIAIRYPKGMQNLTTEQRAKLLADYNKFRLSFGAEVINTDPSKGFGHLEMVPGGGPAEHGAYGKRASYFDADQLYDLRADPREKVNLAKDPAYASVLAEMKAEMRTYLEDLPGDFPLDD